MANHRGAGAPPPKRGGGGGNAKPLYFLSETVNGTDGKPFVKLVKALKLRPDTKNHPVLTLDDFQNMDDGYSVNIHMFDLRGTKDNIVVCPKTAADPRPCPICEVLNKDPTWYVALTAIDRFKYEFDDTKNPGQKRSYQDLKRVVLVTNTWCPRMTVNCERAGGWRGSRFEVSRSAPTKEMRNGREVTSYKDSPRIGDVWYFTEKYDEEKLKAELEKAAATYGLPVEKFVQPFDYDVFFKAKSHPQLTAIANDIKNDGSALKDPEPAAAAAAPATGATDAKAEAELNY